jgi:hypothetical protein
MKKFTLIDIVTMLGIAASILLVLMFASGCSMKFYKQSPADVQNCCDRVSAVNKEMDKFNRYCKIALFLANSDNKKEVGNGIRKGAREAVNICKFVYKVETDADLLAAGDHHDYYRVRSYVITEPDLNGGWINPGCDPAEIHCEGD